MTDYYEILGVERNADADMLKRAFRAQAFKYHPDRNPDNPEAEQKFKEVAQAYEVLSDPQQRGQYDRFRHAGVRGNGGAGATGFHDVNDIFSAFNRVPVTSSNLVSVGYELNSLTLEIEFKNSAVYQYFDVPEFEWQGLMRAASHGTYFSAHIRNKYRYIRL